MSLQFQQILREVSSPGKVTLVYYFGNLSEFFGIFQNKPFNKSAFKKNPVKLLPDILNTFRTIIEKSTPDDYTEPLKPLLEHVFMSMLHPMTPRKIRAVAVEMYFRMINLLTDKADEYIGGFAQYVFNWTVLLAKGTNLSLDIDPKLQIQMGDEQLDDPKTVLVQIEKFSTVIEKSISENEQAFAIFWPFFQKMILSVAFPDQNSKFGIVGQLPSEIQSVICNVFMALMQKAPLFHEIYAKHENQRYFIDAAKQEEIRQSNYTATLFDLITDDNLLKVTPTDLICKGVRILLTALSEEKEMIRKITISFVTKIVKIAEREDIMTIVRVFLGWNATSNMYDVLFLLIPGLINAGIENATIWEMIRNENIGAKLDVLSYIASFYALLMSHKILKYEHAQLEQVFNDTAAMREWKDSRNWIENFRCLLPERILEYFSGHAKEFVKNVFPDTVLYPDINRETLCESFVNLVTGLDWEAETNAKSQYERYLVGDAFIYPLVKVATMIPPGIEADLSFIFTRFINWLFRGCSPENANKKIVTRAIRCLGTLLCSPRSIRFHSDEVISAWYGCLIHHMGSEDEKVVRKATTYACKSVIICMKGCSVLNESILRNLTKASMKNDEKAILFLAVHAPIESYSEIEERARSGALSIRILSDLCAHNTETLGEAVGMIISQLKKFQITDVAMLRSTILILSNSMRSESERILECLIEILQTPPNTDPQTYEQYAAFACSLLIYLESEQSLKKLIEVSKGWESQSLQYLIMTTAAHYRRFPKNIHGVNIPESTTNCFKSGIDNIIQLHENSIVSVLPTGTYHWKFEHVTGVDTNTETQGDIKIECTPSTDAMQYDFQRSFCQQAEECISRMFENPSGVSAASPDNFERLDTTEYESVTTENPKEMKLMPQLGVGTSAITPFLSSFSFFTPIERQILYPSVETIIDENITPSFEEVHVGFSCAMEDSPVFNEFKAGLGVSNTAGDTSEYNDLMVHMIFHNKANGPLQRVQIVWRDGMTSDALISTYSSDTQIRIEIETRDDGRFRVMSYIQAGYTKKVSLRTVVVSKSALTVYCLSRINTLIHHIALNKNVDPLLLAGNTIRYIASQKFVNYDEAFAVEKRLLVNK